MGANSILILLLFWIFIITFCSFAFDWFALLTVLLNSCLICLALVFDCLGGRFILTVLFVWVTLLLSVFFIACITGLVLILIVCFGFFIDVLALIDVGDCCLIVWVDWYLVCIWFGWFSIVAVLVLGLFVVGFVWLAVVLLLVWLCFWLVDLWFILVGLVFVLKFLVWNYLVVELIVLVVGCLFALGWFVYWLF